MTDESPGMMGEPPSARGLSPIPADPAEHAARFGRSWQDLIEPLVERRMRSLGISKDKIGTPDLLHGIKQAAFHPHYQNAGGVSPDGRIVIGSGILNPDLMDSTGPIASAAWREARATDRLNPQPSVIFFTPAHHLKKISKTPGDLGIMEEETRPHRSKLRRLSSDCYYPKEDSKTQRQQEASAQSQPAPRTSAEGPQPHPESPRARTRSAHDGRPQHPLRARRSRPGPRRRRHRRHAPAGAAPAWSATSTTTSTSSSATSPITNPTTS